MKVTLVSLRPTEAALTAERPALTPELLAATGARYSRNNEGLAAILAQIDPENHDASVDRIFRFVDYGHQSIADMAPVALFIDGISIFLAYFLWTLAPTAGGQESSTRYIRLDRDGLVDPETLGIPESDRAEWEADMDAAFAAYQMALSFWESRVNAAPELARIPADLLNARASSHNDSSDRAKRTIARMQRNYAFDRARYFLPVAAKTNVMLIQSARAWVMLCQHLLSHPLREAQLLGAEIQKELALATPRLLRHATAKESFVQGLRAEFAALVHTAQRYPEPYGEVAATPSLAIFLPSETEGEQAIPLDSPPFAEELAFHETRYAYIGPTLRRTGVRFGWQAVAFAEIRDLNRHRTGTKHCPLIPLGFYHATDELGREKEGLRVPATAGSHDSGLSEKISDTQLSDMAWTTLGRIGSEANAAACHRLMAGEATYIYYTLLGTQYAFEHTTTADKFLYEVELRTGAGAHYRYARHLRDVLALWYEHFPTTRGLVLEGSAEPE